MIATPKRQKRRVKVKNIYTYNVTCSFTLQYSFTESEVEQDPEGREEDLSPTAKALRSLEKELSRVLGANYAISDLETYAASDDLLGILKKQ